MALDINQIKRELDEAERLIEITKKTRDEAMRAKTEAETKLKMSQDELAQLGITPENMSEKVKTLEDEITSLLAEIKGDIPVELLRELKRIQ